MENKRLTLEQIDKKLYDYHNKCWAMGDFNIEGFTTYRDFFLEQWVQYPTMALFKEHEQIICDYEKAFLRKLKK